ncbi:Hypothetical predicted protein [Olea europaea subsp. europaea]|uniref:Uncharacterized protein n=1 Tax=Olea europaea subsp. europaea TaxID=158383 RepID=A0A8S0T6C7_OLEEU|nr:Hypothetical predicted protein [Olea europaea subsp. europaea]
MKFLGVPAILLLLLIVCGGHGGVKACEETIDLGNGQCYLAACRSACKGKRGVRADGRCKFVDTCVCKYPCINKLE